MSKINPPEDVKMAREEIERTRERMSDTLDQIEDVLLGKKEDFEEKKADLRRKLDVGAQIRDEPMAAAGIVLAAGFLVGFLTGGGGRKKVRSARKKSRKWEKRAKRLLEIARSQEDEIAALQTDAAALAEAYFHEDADAGSLSDNDDLHDEKSFYEDGLTGAEVYPLDPEFDDETIEYPPRAPRLGGFRDRVGALVADAVESVLDAVPSRR